MRISACLVSLLILGSLNMPAKAQKAKSKPLPSQAQLEKMAARFAPYTIAGRHLKAFSGRPESTGQVDRSRAASGRYFSPAILEWKYQSVHQAAKRQDGIWAKPA